MPEQPRLFSPPVAEGPRLAAPRQLPADVDRARIRCDWLDIRRHHSDRLVLEWMTMDAEDNDPIAAFIGINPSAAGDDASDATCHNGWMIARRHGFRRYMKLNLCSAPCTDPADLLKYSGRPGYANEVAYQARLVFGGGGKVIAAWGALGGSKELRDMLRARRDQLLALLEGVPLWCLGTTEDGSPRHPSRIGHDVRIMPWQRK